LKNLKELTSSDKPSFIIYLGDNMLQNGIKQYLEEFIKNNYDAMLLLKEVEDQDASA